MNQQAGARQTGFTLVEVLVVVVIIGILAGLAIPAIFVAMQKVEDGTAIVEVKLVAQALEAYRSEYGEYPPDFTQPNYVIAHLNRLFPRRREFTSLGDLPLLNPAQALVFWLRGFHPDPEFPITGRFDAAGPLTTREPLMEFNDDMIVAVDSNNNQTGEDPDDDLNLDTPGEVLAPSRMPQSPIVYFDSRRSTGVKQSYELPAGSKRFAGVMPYLSSEILDLKEREDPGLWTRWKNSDERKENLQRKKYYLNPNSFQLISAGRDGLFGNLNNDGKWFPEGFNYDLEDADNITSFSINTLGNSIP